MIVCEQCGATFSRRDSLQRHKKTKHGEHSRAPPPAPLPPVNINAEAPVDMSTYPVIEGDDTLSEVMQKNWGSIISRLRVMKVLDILNIRLLQDDGEELQLEQDLVYSQLLLVWKSIPSRVKINCSYGAILENKDTNEMRYFHSSSNNATVFEDPVSVKSEDELNRFFQHLLGRDPRLEAIRRRPNTKWIIKRITNISFYIYKILAMGKIGKPVTPLPNYILTNRAVIALEKKRNGRPFNDSLCFFRCLAMALDCSCTVKRQCRCKRASERTTKALCEDYLTHTLPADCGEQRLCHGISFADLVTVENLFKVRIVVFSLSRDGVANVEWSSRLPRCDWTQLNVLVHNEHFCYVKRVDLLANAFDCHICESSYTRSNDLVRHVCSPGKTSSIKFPGGVFNPPQTIFDVVLDATGIDVKTTNPELLFYPYAVTYDIECFFPSNQTDSLPKSTSTTTYTAVHELLSISVCSNVPGFDSPRCFIRESSADICIAEFCSYLHEIAKRASALETERWKDVLTTIQKVVERQKVIEDGYIDAGFSNKRSYAARKACCDVLARVDKHIKRIPVVGFNSGKYDINVMKGPLLRYLSENEGIDFAIRKDTAMTCIETESLRFLDIINYVAPGFSYARYLQAFKCKVNKGFFPYEWVDSLEKLEHDCLPPKSAFYSKLTQSNITDEEYAVCQSAWVDHQMTTFRDFLVWYNNLDVVPFIEALGKQCAIFREKKIDMLKSAISLPGLAVRWLFSVVGNSPEPSTLFRDYRSVRDSILQGSPVTLLDDSTSEIYGEVRKNLVGGPSIVFHRYHEKDVTKIRDVEYGAEAKTCAEILGVDANALYLWCMMQKLPTGNPIIRKLEDEFAPHSTGKGSKVAHGWLEWEARAREEEIRHAMNGKEVKIGRHGLPVDGFCAATNTVYQFHGCFWHAHPCSKTSHLGEIHPVRKIPMSEVNAESIKKDAYIRSLGYTLVVVYECEWEMYVNANPLAKGFLRAFFLTFYGSKSTRTESEMISDIKNGTMFGLVKCDLHVPDHLSSKFSEMAPIFKNTEISRADLRGHMKSFAEEDGHLKQPTRTLVGSLFGKEILLFTELLAWYLRHGLIVTKIYTVYQYIPRTLYKTFGDSVSDARRGGDVDPDLALLADTSKLVGNSVYGKTITDKERHKNVVYVSGEKEASLRIKRDNFLSLEEIADEFYEIITRKNKVSCGW